MGRLDSKVINKALVAFDLMERYLVHFEDNYRQVFLQAQRQIARDENALASATVAKGTSSSPMKQSFASNMFVNDLNSSTGPMKSVLKQEVDLICTCKPNEKYKASFKVPKEYIVHSNPDCPFRRLNRVQKWQLKNPNQRSFKNLPLDEDVLYMTMALFDHTMSPDLIRKWITKVQRFFKCHDVNQREFEETVRQVQQKVIDRDDCDFEVDDDGSHAGRIMPFEFLYLLTNAKPRTNIISQLKCPDNNVYKYQLSEFYEGEVRRPDLEQVYPYDCEGNSVRHNPREQLLTQQQREAKDARIKIDDMRKMFKELQKPGQSNLSALERDTNALIAREMREALKKAANKEKIDARRNKLGMLPERQKSSVSKRSDGTGSASRRLSSASKVNVGNLAGDKEVEGLTNQMLNMTEIPEKAGKAAKTPKRELSDEVIKEFKNNMINKDFFIKLKLIMYEIDQEMQMTRNGGAVSDDYIQVMKNKGELCVD